MNTDPQAYFRIPYPWTIATAHGLIQHGYPGDYWRPLFKTRKMAETSIRLLYGRPFTRVLFPVPLPEYGDKR